MSGLSNIATGRGQNRSTAVMQRRRHAAPESLDYFPTPPWASRALCEFLGNLIINLDDLTAWEPACGEMHMVRPLREYFAEVRASDVCRYTDDHELLDFALLIAAGLKVATVGVAMLVRSAFLEGQDRYENLYKVSPPDFVLQFVERVAMLEGRLVRAGDVDPFSEDGNKVSSATAYSWLVWLKDGCGDTRMRWIAPCRARLERPGDYPAYEVAQLPPPEDGLFGTAAAA